MAFIQKDAVVSAAVLVQFMFTKKFTEAMAMGKTLVTMSLAMVFMQLVVIHMITVLPYKTIALKHD